jgi:hypothetical protein
LLEVRIENNYAKNHLDFQGLEERIGHSVVQIIAFSAFAAQNPMMSSVHSKEADGELYTAVRVEN